MSPASVVTLRESTDGGGSRHLWARRTTAGDVVIEGQDVGGGVEEIFGEGIREYEWTWTIRAANVPALLGALGAGDDVLTALGRRFSGDRAADLYGFLEDHGVPFEAWSRVGD